METNNDGMLSYLKKLDTKLQMLIQNSNVLKILKEKLIILTKNWKNMG
jgi:hypothetical protein